MVIARPKNTQNNNSKKILRNPSRMELSGLYMCGLAIYFFLCFGFVQIRSIFFCSSKKSHDRISFIFTAIHCRGHTFFWVEDEEEKKQCLNV